MSIVMERALALATMPHTNDAEIAFLEKEIAHLTDLYSRLLPIEAAAQSEVSAKGRELRTRLTKLTAARELDLPMLNTGVLGWTKLQPAWWNLLSRQLLNVPVFAYVPIKSGRCEILVSRSGTSMDAPKFVHDAYAVTKAGLRRHLSTNPFDGRRRITLSYIYQGVIPDTIREIIHKEQDEQRFDDLALICEVDKWSIDEQHVPRRLLDPILVGVRSEALWVLGSFDPTPVEDYIAREFTS